MKNSRIQIFLKTSDDMKSIEKRRECEISGNENLPLHMFTGFFQDTKKFSQQSCDVEFGVDTFFLIHIPQPHFAHLWWIHIVFHTHRAAPSL